MMHSTNLELYFMWSSSDSPDLFLTLPYYMLVCEIVLVCSNLCEEMWNYSLMTFIFLVIPAACRPSLSLVRI